MNQVRDWVVRDWVIVQVRWRFRERVYDQVRDQDLKRVDLQVPDFNTAIVCNTGKD